MGALSELVRKAAATLPEDKNVGEAECALAKLKRHGKMGSEIALWVKMCNEVYDSIGGQNKVSLVQEMCEKFPSGHFVDSNDAVDAGLKLLNGVRFHAFTSFPQVVYDGDLVDFSTAVLDMIFSSDDTGYVGPVAKFVIRTGFVRHKTF